MVQNVHAEAIITGIKGDLLINNLVEGEKVLPHLRGHFDERVLILDQGLYVIRER